MASRREGGEVKMDKKAVLAYLFFFFALVAVGAYVAGLIPESTMIVVLGVFGFSGIGALRQFVNVHGWKTWFSVAMGFVGVLLEVFGVFTPDALAKWLTIWGLLAGGGMAHALKKSGG